MKRFLPILGTLTICLTLAANSASASTCDGRFMEPVENNQALIGNQAGWFRSDGQPCQKIMSLRYFPDTRSGLSRSEERAMASSVSAMFKEFVAAGAAKDLNCHVQDHGSTQSSYNSKVYMIFYLVCNGPNSEAVDSISFSPFVSLAQSKTNTEFQIIPPTQWGHGSFIINKSSDNFE